MSIADQLNNLKTSVVNVFEVNTKHKTSLIYKDGSFIGRAETLQDSRKGFLKLCKINTQFNQFKDIYSENTIDLVLQELNVTELNEIERKIRHFLCLIIPYLQNEYVIAAYEWLIYKFEIHNSQPEYLLMSCLPYYNYPIFIKFIRLLNTEVEKFSWLKPIITEGEPISALYLSGICMKHPNVLQMICSWPTKIVELTKNDEEELKELCQTVLDLGNHILEKLIYKRKEKREKYLGPFIRIISDGLKGTHNNFYHTALLLLDCFSEKIQIDENLLKNSIEQILTNGIVGSFDGLVFVYNLCRQQNYSLNENLKRLCQENINKLDNALHRCIVGRMIENKEKDNSITIDIDWSKEELEEELCGLLSRFVLNWEELNYENIENRDGKKALNCLKLIKSGKPKEKKFQYKTNGLISHLHFAIMHPDSEIRKIVLKILKSFSVVRPEVLHILGDFIDGVDIEFNEKAYKLILAEMNKLVGESPSLTIVTTIITMIYSKNIAEIPKLDNIWKMFLSELNPNISVEERNARFREIFTKCFDRISDSFGLLTESDQQSVLFSLTNGLKRRDSNKTIDFLSRLKLSNENYKFLLKDINNKRKSMKKSQSELRSPTYFYTNEILDKVNIVLSVFCRNNSMPVDHQLDLLEIVLTIFGRTVTHLSRNKLSISDIHEPCNDTFMIDLVTNIMSSVLSVLTSVINSEEKVNLDSISKKIQLEVFSKCLYLFNSSSLNKLNLMVIQNIVKLNLGLDHFKLKEFISWICINLVPEKDILNNIINETLPLLIKQKKPDFDDKRKIIIEFIRACASLPKDRVLFIFQSIVKSLSLFGESVLYIQLLFMIVIKPTTQASSNFIECLILPLLKKFPIEEQIMAFQKIILFLSAFVLYPRGQRRPRDASKDVKLIIANQFKDFDTVKDHLVTIDRNLDAISLFNTVIKSSVIHFNGDLSGVVKTIKDFISSLFATMKLINHSNLQIYQQNAFFKFFSKIIKEIELCLSSNSYLSLIADLLINENDEFVKSKVLQLFGSKLCLLDARFSTDEELDGIIPLIMPTITKVIIDKPNLFDWSICLMCASKIVVSGFMTIGNIELCCANIFLELLKMNFNNMLSDKIILTNNFFKNYVDTGICKEWKPLFKCCLKGIGKCIHNQELNNGELESGLSLMHSLMSLQDPASIECEIFGDLLENIFQLVSLDYQLSDQSCEYLKHIRIKLTKIPDTKSLINTCVELIEKGCTTGNVFLISESLSLFGCHLTHLNTSQINYSPDRYKDEIWHIIYCSLSVNEKNFIIKESDWCNIQNLTIQAINQLCILSDFDSEIMSKLLAFTQKSDISPKFYLERNSTFFRCINDFISKSNYTEKSIKFLNNFEYISYASTLLKNLSMQSEACTNECPKQFGNLIQSICQALSCHLKMHFTVSIALELSSTIFECMRIMARCIEESEFLNITTNSIIPLIVQMAVNPLNDETILLTMALELMANFTENTPQVQVTITILKNLKERLGDDFNSDVRKNVTKYLEKLIKTSH